MSNNSVFSKVGVSCKIRTFENKLERMDNVEILDSIVMNAYLAGMEMREDDAGEYMACAMLARKRAKELYSTLYSNISKLESELRLLKINKHVVESNKELEENVEFEEPEVFEPLEDFEDMD